MIRSSGQVSLWVRVQRRDLFVGHVHEANATQRADQKYHVEPAVIEVELQIAQDFRYDYPTNTTVQRQLGYNIIHILNK